MLKTLVATSLLQIAVYNFIEVPWAPHISSAYTDYTSFLEAKTYGVQESYFKGSLVHTPPLVVEAMAWLPDLGVFSVLLGVRLITAFYLFRITQSRLAVALYMLDPSLSRLNLSTFTQFAVLLFSYYSLVRRRTRAALCLSLLCYLDPSYLPLATLYYFKNFTKTVYLTGGLLSLALYGASYYLTGSWEFLHSCQLSVLFSQDLRPNLGLSWYLLLEMFQKYQSFYRTVLVVHPWLYIYTIRYLLLKYQRTCNYSQTGKLYLAVVYCVCVVCHPSPMLGDYILGAVLMFPHAEIILRVPSAFLTVTGFLVGQVLSLVMWGMWGTRIGGNANFLFFQLILVNTMCFGFLFGLLQQVKQDIEEVSVT